MHYIGAHVSCAGGLETAVLRAYEINSTAFSLFTKNQRQWFSPPLLKSQIKKFTQACVKYKFKSNQIFPHGSYLVNLGHPIDSLLKKSRASFIDEIIRCRQLNLRFLNVHPGSHLNSITESACLIRVSESINIALDHTKDVMIVIENTAGQGTNIGYCFEHLSEIIHHIYDKSRIGICIDTCHLFSSGYDLRTTKDCENTFKLFDQIIGLNYLTGIHLNDSKTDFNSRIDRHQNLGLGKIGTVAFQWIMNNKSFYNIPIILETTDKELWKQEIAWLRLQNKNYHF